MARRPKPWFRSARKCWFVTVDGIQHNLGPDKKAAFEQFHKLMCNPKAVRLNELSVAALADMFLDWVQKKRSADTYEWYRYRLQRFVQKYPDLIAADLRPYHVDAWVDDYSFSTTSRRNYMRSIKRCMNWAIRQGLIETNPLLTLEMPAAEHREVAFSQSEFELLLSYIRNEELRDLVITTWETGCRPQESLRVEARHVDLRHRRWVIPVRESKTKRHTRVIYLNERAFEITQRRLELFPSGHLFRNTKGIPWTADSVNSAFMGIRQRIGRDEIRRRGILITPEELEAKIKTLSPTKRSKNRVVKKTRTELKVEAKRKLLNALCAELAPPFSLYALRHSWATQALMRGVDPLTVAILMGHSDPSMLSKVYQHLALNPQHMLAEAERATRPLPPTDSEFNQRQDGAA